MLKQRTAIEKEKTEGTITKTSREANLVQRFGARTSSPFQMQNKACGALAF